MKWFQKKVRIDNLLVLISDDNSLQKAPNLKGHPGSTLYIYGMEYAKLNAEQVFWHSWRESGSSNIFVNFLAIEKNLNVQNSDRSSNDTQSNLSNKIVIQSMPSDVE